MTKPKPKKKDAAAKPAANDSSSSSSSSSSKRPAPPEGAELVAGTEANPGWRPITDDDGAVQDTHGTYYCPGCGIRYAEPGKCNGTAAGPHAAIKLAPVAELAGDPAGHTAAPNTGS